MPICSWQVFWMWDGSDPEFLLEKVGYGWGWLLCFLEFSVVNKTYQIKLSALGSLWHLLGRLLLPLNSIYYVKLCFSPLLSGRSALIIKLSFLYCNMNMYAWYMYTYVEMTSSKWILPATLQFLRRCEEAQLCIYFTVYQNTPFPVVPMFLSPAFRSRSWRRKKKRGSFYNCSQCN